MIFRLGGSEQYVRGVLGSHVDLLSGSTEEHFQCQGDKEV
jgi:hypothetical protein